MEQDEVLQELEDSGLRGRGGAGFSMGKKASFLPRGEMAKYLCCNADESEPGAFKDRELMQRNPHQLIEGIAIAALAADAGHAFIFIRGEYDEQADILDAAVAEAYEAGYLGTNILGCHRDLELVVHRGAGAYICGEETALLDALEGKRGNPRLKPPFPAVQGLYGGPTLINNVETLSNVPHIVRHGAEWFKGFGTEQSPGTKVVSVSGGVRRPGNYEVELGIPTRELIYGLAGGPEEGHEIKAFFPGGSSSPVLTAEEGLDLPYSFEAMAEAGSMLGSGSIIVADDRVSIPHLALRTARFYHHESCGKCVPCREGTNWTVKMLERMVRGEATPMDLDIVSSVQQNIIGHCLCVLGDSMAMPVGAMVRKFREEFEAVMADPELVARPARRRPRRARDAGSLDVSPAGREVTITIDGREVPAVEGEMLHDAARKGDVEIPFFCYEPKLGDPVGACRMCLVEIEGIPKLQTSCSTPVREGMVVHTRTEQVKEAQSAVVEFLLVNHPLDCPVCDKGGECPLQDISYGWGPGRSRVIDEKRHFEKPIELSPLVAIDRERCILCYRCVRFSQEVAEDAQLQLIERGDRTYVGTFDDRPYVAPFHGNITDICPVGALTSYTYRFRARPWDIEHAGSVCTLCPSQCNVSFTVRDEKVKRVIARDNHEVDDGWLCDRGRYGFEMFDAPERVRGPRLKGGEASWEQALGRGRATGLRAAGRRQGRGDRRRRLQRGGLPAAAAGPRGARLAPHRLAPLARARGRRAAAPGRAGVSAKVRDIDEADAILVLGTDPLHSSPILDLRVRKAIRRNGAKLVVATERPTALDGGAEAIARYAPGQAAHFVSELASAIGGAENVATPVAETLRDAGKVVVIWGERIAREDGAAEALLDVAKATGMATTDGAGLLEIPDTTNARGLREAGCLPDAGPGLTETTAGMSTEEIRQRLISGEITGLILFGADPLRDFPDTPAWEEALTAADFVVTFSMHENATTAKSDVVLPLETHAEKDGTVTHPDGRLQRVRPSASRPENVLPNIIVLSELASKLGLDTGIDSQPTAFAALTQAVSFYNGIEDQEVGGRGLRWQDRQGSTSARTGTEQPGPGGPAGGTRRTLCATRQSAWSSPTPLLAESRPPSPPLLVLRRLKPTLCFWGRTETSGPAP